MSRTFKIMVGSLVGLFVLSLALTAMACGGGGGLRIYRPSYSCNYSQPTVIVREAPPQPQVYREVAAGSATIRAAEPISGTGAAAIPRSNAAAIPVVANARADDQWYADQRRSN